ncbi:MAG: hypothetical protein HYT28_02215 [Parcubacteria group bacterium]|nr:hypothetical protein [Parcubacteria group bacterium]
MKKVIFFIVFLCFSISSSIAEAKVLERYSKSFSSSGVIAHVDVYQEQDDNFHDWVTERVDGGWVWNKNHYPVRIEKFLIRLTANPPHEETEVFIGYLELKPNEQRTIVGLVTTNVSFHIYPLNVDKFSETKEIGVIKFGNVPIAAIP